MTISTPCIRVCVLDEATRLCIGCGRNAAEIGGWMAMGEEARRRVMAELETRLARLPAATREAAFAREGIR